MSKRWQVICVESMATKSRSVCAGWIAWIWSPDQEIEALAYDLPRIAVVALAFPKFGDGRAFSSARLLRERFAYTGEVRAVGDVLVELGGHMVRCGFDAFEPADGSQPAQWAHVATRHRHVYQRAADARTPAYALRGE